MAYTAEVIADSVSENDDRLTTLTVTFPRIVLSEFNTHRMLSRNSASSRAIPVEKQIGRVLDEPFIPEKWEANQPGMQPGPEIPLAERELARASWLTARDMAVLGACALIGGLKAEEGENDARRELRSRIAEIDERYGFGLAAKALAMPIHKEIANRLLEPFMWHTVVVTATEWDNFFALRNNQDTQYQIREPARLIQAALASHSPRLVKTGEYHLPYVQEDELGLPLQLLAKIAVARCARVSYLTHDEQRDRQKDVRLHDQLLTGGHMSPFEHVATPMGTIRRLLLPRSGNFRGWKQYRKTIAHEDNFAEILELQEAV